MAHRHDEATWEKVAAIGRRIAVARKLANMDQMELSAKLSFIKKYSSTVSKWETGKQAPHPTQFPELADTLEVTIDYLLRGE